MSFKKIFGWFLLIIGVSIIFSSLYFSYNIFTAKTDMPKIFKMPEEDISFLKEKELSIQEEMQQTIEEQIGKILPASTIPALLNLVAWSIFAGIMILGGAQISGLGIKLIKQ
ncbi:hypothetical protein KAT95_02465 [Candidatus Parcubacteria bacterium]|nr:hypothetical protein [Candidatus Parcubacteria bacterium]